ncbi:MAG: hypothetical protein MHM6MM_006714, partial [Cercozoa sp. M6MM]
MRSFRTRVLARLRRPVIVQRRAIASNIREQLAHLTRLIADRPETHDEREALSVPRLPERFDSCDALFLKETGEDDIESARGYLRRFFHLSRQLDQTLSVDHDVEERVDVLFVGELKAAILLPLTAYNAYSTGRNDEQHRRRSRELAAFMHSFLLGRAKTHKILQREFSAEEDESSWPRRLRHMFLLPVLTEALLVPQHASRYSAFHDESIRKYERSEPTSVLSSIFPTLVPNVTDKNMEDLDGDVAVYVARVDLANRRFLTALCVSLLHGDETLSTQERTDLEYLLHALRVDRMGVRSGKTMAGLMQSSADLLGAACGFLTDLPRGRLRTYLSSGLRGLVHADSSFFQELYERHSERVAARCADLIQVLSASSWRFRRPFSDELELLALASLPDVALKYIEYIGDRRLAVLLRRLNELGFLALKCDTESDLGLMRHKEVLRAQALLHSDRDYLIAEANNSLSAVASQNLDAFARLINARGHEQGQLMSKLFADVFELRVGLRSLICDSINSLHHFILPVNDVVREVRKYLLQCVRMNWLRGPVSVVAGTPPVNFNPDLSDMERDVYGGTSVSAAEQARYLAWRRVLLERRVVTRDTSLLLEWLRSTPKSLESLSIAGRKGTVAREHNNSKFCARAACLLALPLVRLTKHRL